MRVDALRVQVEAHGDEVNVAGALALPEQATLDAVGSGQHGQFRGSHAGAAVVVVVGGQDHVFAPRQVPAHPLDLVGVYVGGGTLNGGGQVEDDLAIIGRLPDVHDRFADLEGKVEFGVDKDLGGILVADDDVVIHDLFQVVHNVAGAVNGELLRGFLVIAKHDVAEDGCGRVIQVDRGPREAFESINGPVNKVGAGLGKNGDGDVFGNRVIVDEGTDEVQVGLGGGRETNLDFLVSHSHEQIEHGSFAGGIHGLNECLVAVPQVGREPAGCLRDALAGPLTVRQVNGVCVEEGPVLAEWHAGGALLIMWSGGFHCFSCSACRRTGAS